ncbi:HAF repeat-containing protein [Telluria beijingensis]|uniref:HAF repeat-containing protein n=1 Tax=Telluria beijingensis TaxID=3068633 RepID=UPI0027960BD8|nr:HAF repeat-containing protein [Massilia sp. REN29]
MSAARFLAVLLAVMLAVSQQAEAGGKYVYEVFILGWGSAGEAINHRGQIAGRGGGHAFLYANGMVTDLGTLPGNTESAALGINRQGQVVGSAFGLNQPTRAFLYSGGLMRDIGSLAGGDTTAMDINDAGHVVGISVLQVTFPFAFLYKDGLMRNLGSLPGSDRSGATAINNRGEIAGTSGVGPSQGPNGNQAHAVVWKNGHIHDLGTLGGLNSIGQDINDLGQVVGYSTFAGGDFPNENYGGFIWANGKMRDIGAPPGGNQALPLAINNLGQVVGGYNRSGEGRTFLYSRQGGMRDLSSLVNPSRGWTIVYASDINDRSQITGVGCDYSGSCVAVRLDPWYLHRKKFSSE